MKKKLLALTALAIFSSQAMASRDMDWVLSIGADFGGDAIAGVVYTNGSSKDVKAGQLVHLAGGVAFDTLADKKTLQTQATIGWKFDDVSAKNGDMSFNRFPFELIQFIDLSRLKNPMPWRIGAGLTYHLSPSISSSGAAKIPDITFDNALGYLLEVDYQIDSQQSVGVRATRIDYTINTATVNGNSIGILWSIRF